MAKKKKMGSTFDQLMRDQEIVDELLTPPGTVAGGHRVELAIELAGAGAAEEREVEEVGQPVRVRIRFRVRRQQIGKGKILELARRTLATKPAVREEDGRDAAQHRGVRPVRRPVRSDG